MSMHIRSITVDCVDPYRQAVFWSQLTGWQGRRVARAQTQAVRDAGGIVVDLAAETGAVFRADAGTLCYDGFHPSADGYRVWAYALLPAVAHAAGVTPRLP